MTATCREACCSVTPRFTVAELFERGYRRIRETPLPVQGEAVADSEGNSARFSLAISDGTLAGTRFQATACTTLIAYCEAITELLAGFSAEMAGQFSSRDLVDALPGVPALKQDRAVLAIAAFRSALQTAQVQDLSWPGERREAPSSRLKARPSTPSHAAQEGVDARNRCGHDQTTGGEA
jgi:NifU-like protein involved in Fe-S cluster formation